MTTIYQNLYKAAQIAGLPAQAATEKDEDFLLRLLRTIGTLPDVEWESLPRSSQLWYVSAAEAHQASQPLPLCPGFKDNLTQQVIPTHKQKVVLKSTLKPLKKKKGALNTIRETILLHPDWSNKQVHEHVIQTWPETKEETVAVNGSDIRHTLDLAKRMGWTPPSTKLGKHEDKNSTETKKIS
jgi:hypothetical protein